MNISAMAWWILMIPSTDITITVWWFELTFLGGWLNLLFLVVWYFPSFFKVFGLPRLEKDAQARDGTANVWRSLQTFHVWRCGRGLATSRYSQLIWTWAIAGPYLQTLCIWLMCASTRLSGRRVLAEHLPSKVVWLRNPSSKQISYWSALFQLTEPTASLRCTSLPACDSKESVSECNHLWQRRARVRESESALHHQKMMKWSIGSIGSIGLLDTPGPSAWPFLKFFAGLRPNSLLCVRTMWSYSANATIFPSTCLLAHGPWGSTTLPSPVSLPFDLGDQFSYLALCSAI